jgi:hypothetical protein
MYRSKHLRVTGVLAGCLLTLSITAAATAMPINLIGTATPQTLMTDVRYRRSIPPAAVFGLFGAVLGAAIANSNNDNYDNYSYYAYGPSYSGGYRGGVGGRGRGGGGHAGGAAHARAGRAGHTAGAHHK